MPRKRLFESPAPIDPQIEPEGRSARIDDAKRTLFVTVQGEVRAWNFGRLPTPKLSRELAELLMCMARSNEYISSMSTLRAYLRDVSKFIRTLSTRAKQVRCLRDIDLSAIEAFDRQGMTIDEWSFLSRIVRCFRAARALFPSRISPELKSEQAGSRLRIVSKYPKPDGHPPRNPYSPRVVKQVHIAARKEVAAALRRIKPELSKLESLLGMSPDHAASEQLSGADLALISLCDPALGKQLERDRGDRPLVGVRRLTRIDAVPLEILKLAATKLTAGEKVQDVETEFGLRPKLLWEIQRFSADFVRMQKECERAYVAETMSILQERRRSEAEVEERLVWHTEVAGQQKDFVTQLRLRRGLLEVWNDLSVPQYLLGHLPLKFEPFMRWQLSHLGVENVWNEFLRRSSERETRELAEKIHKLLARLASRYGMLKWRGHLDRNQLIEGYLANELPSSAIEGLVPNLKSFRTWKANSNLPPIGRMQNATTHPIYGAVMKWTSRLLRCLVYIDRQRLDAAGESRLILEIPKPVALSEAVSPTLDELNSFVLLLLTVSEVDVASAMGAERDCLQNEYEKMVDFIVRKARAGYAELVYRVPDRGLNTAGGLVRSMLKVTTAPHLALKATGSRYANRLLVAFSRGKPGPFAFPGSGARIREFCTRNVILDDNGKKIDKLTPARFRKSPKAERYLASGGNLRVVATDNSLTIAAKHYANLPALAHIHDKTVEAGLRQALHHIQGRVIPHMEAIEAEARRLSAVTGRTIAECLACLQGSEDVWLAGCLAFRDSPFASKGTECPTPYTECLVCPNSVFTERKLPNLLRYHRFITFRRQTMPPATWQKTLAADLYALEELILPRFSQLQIDRARATIASDHGFGDLYIPLEIRMAI